MSRFSPGISRCSLSAAFLQLELPKDWPAEGSGARSCQAGHEKGGSRRPVDPFRIAVYDQIQVIVILYTIIYYMDLCCIYTVFAIFLYMSIIYIVSDMYILYVTLAHDMCHESQEELRDRKEAADEAGGISFRRMAVTLMLRHAASIIVKLWLPVWLGAAQAVPAMLLMYLLEANPILELSMKYNRKYAYAYGQLIGFEVLWI